MRFSLLTLTLFSSVLGAAENDVGPKKPTCVLIENGRSSHTAELLKELSKCGKWKVLYKSRESKPKAHCLCIRDREMDALRATLTNNDVLLTVVDNDCATYDDIIHTEDGPLESTMGQHVKLFTITSGYMRLKRESSEQSARIEAEIQKIIGDRKTRRILVPTKHSLEIFLVENLPTREAKLIGALLKDACKKQKTAADKKKKSDAQESCENSLSSKIDTSTKSRAESLLEKLESIVVNKAHTK